MIELHRATATDVPDIHALVRAAYGPWIPVVGREPLPMRVDYAAVVAAPITDPDRIAAHIVDLHRVDGVLVAMIEMQAMDDALLIVNVAVAPDHQGHGIGRALLAHAEDVAASLRLPATRLYTNVLMTTNVTLYRRLGYDVDHEEAVTGGTIVHMRKSLARAG